MSQFKTWFGKKKEAGIPEQLDETNIPKHVAIIMDGNGRWARRRGLPRAAGHHAGMKAIKRVTVAADNIGVEVLSLYSFSTENWKRPRDEVDYLMKLPQEFLALELDELIEKNVRVRMTGWKEGVPAHTLGAVEEAVEKTKNNTGLILNFAFNYGSRMEMMEAVRGIVKAVQSGELTLEQVDEASLESRLQTAGLPDPDLLIRTSGERRISNFMLWQLAYTELIFSDLYWPDFSDEHLYEAILEYQSRNRRFGGL
ncbi:isoprenyl transferase [Paenibacillus sp. J31TS4]|uniref:isoprenyl transferase n=1 Tax=Paenibacillus sp. J31TS4 TaxID=2807195 RepID=UPI001B1970E8|nr:isoprenyl transferase [Paenibacillus sp. J31TS4]GIP36846.1 isoprenyl transferase [Paenibacillus sp. J31TS4]